MYLPIKCIRGSSDFYLSLFTLYFIPYGSYHLFSQQLFSEMFCVGEVDDKAKELIRTTYRAWQASFRKKNSIYASWNCERLTASCCWLCVLCLAALPSKPTQLREWLNYPVLVPWPGGYTCPILLCVSSTFCLLSYWNILALMMMTDCESDSRLQISANLASNSQKLEVGFRMCTHFFPHFL